MKSSSSGTSISDIAYLSRSEHRVPTLASLAVRPQTRSELADLTGVSSSTIRRTLYEYEDRHWVSKHGHHYEATQLGAFIATAMVDLLERFETERKLRDVWQRLPGEEDGFTIDMCIDSVVTKAQADDPFRPVNRFAALLEETESLRIVGFDVALLEPCKDKLCQRIIDGLEAEIINLPRVVKYIRSTYPDRFSEAFESGNLTVRIHDDLPSYGVCLFDDRIAISCYDTDNVTVRLLVDTDAQEAAEWAESTYRSFRRTPTIPIETVAE